MRNANITIRHAVEADIDELHSMQQRSFRILGGAYYPPKAIEAFIGAIGTMDDAVVREGHYFVAVDGRSRIVASAGWSQLVPRYAGASEAPPREHDRAIVRSVFVDGEMARMGLGTAIMRHTEADAREHGITRLSLTATLSGIPFYRAMGYRDLTPTEVNLDVVSIRFLKMEKSIEAVQDAA